MLTWLRRASMHMVHGFNCFGNYIRKTNQTKKKKKRRENKRKEKKRKDVTPLKKRMWVPTKVSLFYYFVGLNFGLMTWNGVIFPPGLLG